MDKKYIDIITITLALTLINTGILGFLTFDKIKTDIQNRPVVISREYDKGQSIEKALLTEKPMIVWFYTDWCRYCQRFAPTFKKLTNKKTIKKEYAAAYVNSEDPINEKIVKEYNVEGYPTVFLVNKNKKEMVPPTDLFSPDALERLEEKMLNYIKE